MILFRVFDIDKNGYISKDELCSLVNTLFHLIPDSEITPVTSTPEKVVDEIFAEIDDNQDGVITKEELIRKRRERSRERFRRRIFDWIIDA